MYCQKCRTPLKADTSLQTLNPAAFDLLVGSVNRSQRKLTASTTFNYPPERRSLYEKTISDTQSPIYKRNVPAPVTEDESKASKSQVAEGNPGMSFIEITESQIVPTPEQKTVKDVTSLKSIENKTTEKGVDTALSRHLQRHEALYSILSSHSDIDQPICSECSVLLISAFNARLASSTREREAYAFFLKSLQQAPTRNSVESSRKELEGLVTEEEEVFKELSELEEERSKLEIELAKLEEQNRELDEREQYFWKSRNAFDDQLHGLEIDLTSLQQKFAHDHKQLERLQRTNVYNDTFCIGHDGYFGTINGLRLGRLPNQNVEWAEINAAWGQTLLLLATVAERLSFNFQGYRLRPLGSTSRIERLEWPQQIPELPKDLTSRQSISTNPPPKVTQLDLYSHGDIPLGRVFNHRRFDAGMVAFLDCLSQLGNFVEKASKPLAGRTASPAFRPSTLMLPYTVEGDKIGGVSIRLGVGFSQDENFTKACKYALTCCKFLLAHVSNLDGSKVAENDLRR